MTSTCSTGRDTFGGWHKVALETLAKLGLQLAWIVGRDKSETVRHFQHCLGEILIRDNMQLLLSSALDILPLQIAEEM